MFHTQIQYRHSKILKKILLSLFCKKSSLPESAGTSQHWKKVNMKKFFFITLFIFAGYPTESKAVLPGVAHQIWCAEKSSPVVLVPWLLCLVNMFILGSKADSPVVCTLFPLFATGLIRLLLDKEPDSLIGADWCANLMMTTVTCLWLFHKKYQHRLRERAIEAPD